MPWPFFKRAAPVLTEEKGETSTSASTRFAFKLFRELAQSSSANVFFSPPSVLLCVAMVHELGSGETRKAMAEVLELSGLTPEQIEAEIALLKSSLRARPEVEVTFANSLWLALHAHITTPLAARLRDVYESEWNVVNFATGDAVPAINEWVSSKTRGKISRIVNELSPLTALVALNAVYFKGLWSNPFRRSFTQEGPFTYSAGQTRQLPMMTQSGNYHYYEDRQSQMVALPYNGRLSMVVVLPAEGVGPREFQAGLFSGAWDSLCSRLRRMDGSIRIPRFKLSYDAGLKSALSDLGMERAFDRQRAEFESIETRQPPVWIDNVIHRAVAEVNEEGTEAAAVTAVVTRCLSAMPSKPKPHFTMIVNRPFLVAILDDATKTILFLGWIGNPNN